MRQRKPAAIVSRSGALPTYRLCPRRCSASPVVSSDTVQRSSSIRTFTAISASVVTGMPASEIARTTRCRAALS
jgi:hypothetical protein